MHTRNGRQAAMVVVGYAANETLGHWSVTQEVNLGFMIGWPIVLGFLIWYAWFRKERVPAL
ncbi:MAG: hypothetical protein ACKOTD_04405 [Phycisphaerales bacterium]